jgi:hypothetical protein
LFCLVRGSLRGRGAYRKPTANIVFTAFVHDITLPPEYRESTAERCPKANATPRA